MPLTKLNNKAVANVTSLPVALGDMVLVSSATASSSATIDFTLGDYKEYQFYFVNMHPSAGSSLQFNLSIDSGSNYNVTKTTTWFSAYHTEDGTQAALGYVTSQDLAQSTAFQNIIGVGTANDDNLNGTLTLFNPSSTIYVKHFIGKASSVGQATQEQSYTAGYANTTSALTNIRFKFASGNIDDGKILMFGIN